MRQIYNAEPSVHRPCFYKTVGKPPNEGTELDHITLLPGINFVDEAEAEAAGVLSDSYPDKSVVYETDVLRIPQTDALRIVERSVSIAALTMWQLAEKRDAVKQALSEKIGRRKLALAGELPKEKTEADGNPE